MYVKEVSFIIGREAMGTQSLPVLSGWHVSFCVMGAFLTSESYKLSMEIGGKWRMKD